MAATGTVDHLGDALTEVRNQFPTATAEPEAARADVEHHAWTPAKVSGAASSPAIQRRHRHPERTVGTGAVAKAAVRALWTCGRSVRWVGARLSRRRRLIGGSNGPEKSGV